MGAWGVGTLDNDFSGDFEIALADHFGLDEESTVSHELLLSGILGNEGKTLSKWIKDADKGKSILGFSSGGRQTDDQVRQDNDWMIMDLATRALLAGTELDAKAWILVHEAAQREMRHMMDWKRPQARKNVLLRLDDAALSLEVGESWDGDPKKIAHNVQLKRHTRAFRRRSARK